MTADNATSCPVCSSAIEVQQRLGNLSDVRCANCGRFLITLAAIEQMEHLPIGERVGRLLAATARSTAVDEKVPVIFAAIKQKGPPKRAHQFP